jgi:5-methylcytosine-specific restriction endonuclease McrA
LEIKNQVIVLEKSREYYLHRHLRRKIRKHQFKLNNKAHKAKRRKIERENRIHPFKINARVVYWGNRCWLCGGEYESIDHVIPLSKGGKHLPANLRPACLRCNNKKGNKDLVDVVSLMVREKNKPNLP